MKNYKLVIALCGTALSLLLIVATAQAQPGTGGPPVTPTQIPIDGGASLLLVGGVVLGLKKLRDQRRVS